MNINEQIYEVYKEEKKIQKLLDTIYNGINREVQVSDFEIEENNKIAENHDGVENKDDLNNETKGRYKFFDLEKFENGIIHGRFGYIKAGTHASYDPDNDTVKEEFDQNKIDYITFYFDLDKEALAFTTSQSLKYSKIFAGMEAIIKKGTSIGVSFKLETDITTFKKEIKKIHTLKKINVSLVPPNGARQDFADLFSVDADRIENAEVTKIDQIYSTRKKDGLKADSALVSKIISGVGLGYADASFSGYDINKDPISVNSNREAPFTENIPQKNNKDKTILARIAQKGITLLLQVKANIRDKGE
jgi:hypothetical protein